MTTRTFSSTAWRALIACLLAAPLALQAQDSATQPAVDWRSANDTVGQFKRGHADVLRWELAHLPPPAVAAQTPAELRLLSAEDAVRQAWRSQPKLATALARLGPQAQKHIAAGQWIDLDPSLFVRIHDADEVLKTAVQARKVWLQAVAAQQVVHQRQQGLQAAQAGNELGRRMVSVGNWSALQRSQVQLAESVAQMDLTRARYAAALAQADLLRLLQLSGVHAAVELPEQLPGAALPALSQEQVQRRLEALRAQLPRAEGLRARADAQLALTAYQASQAVLHASQNEVLTLQQFITEQTVLHYNGMLKSVWDLLGQARMQSQAVIDAIETQRDFLLAETDLQWVLQGGAPAYFVSLADAGADAAAPGH